jgi:hypothetical protein
LSDDLTDIFSTILDSAGLSPEKRTECNQQATLVLVGLSTTKEFKAYIVDDLKLDTATAQTLFDSISANIFIPVRDCLLRAFDTIKNSETKQVSKEDTHSDPYREQMV